MTMNPDAIGLFSQPNQISCTTKVFTIEDLPPFSCTGDRTGATRFQQIALYLRNLTLAHQSGLGSCFLLPSLVSLGEVFNTPQHEMFEALRELRRLGLDIFIPGLYGHISLWDQALPTIPETAPLSRE